MFYEREITHWPKIYCLILPFHLNLFVIVSTVKTIVLSRKLAGLNHRQRIEVFRLNHGNFHFLHLYSISYWLHVLLKKRWYVFLIGMVLMVLLLQPYLFPDLKRKTSRLLVCNGIIFNTISCQFLTIYS